MSLTAYLDVFIGLAFVYLILSLIVTIVFESVAQFTRLRARNLQRAIRKLLEESQSPPPTNDGKAGKSIADKFYDHPIVRSLSKEKSKKPSGDTESGKGPSFFVQIWTWLRSTTHFSYIKPKTFSLVAMNTLFPDEDLGKNSAQDLISLAEKLPESKIKGVMLTHLRSGAKNLEALREGIESWFDETMERLSGWFTRTARWVSFIIGLIVAIGLNVDTLVVANALWREPTLRETVADYAEKNYENYPPDIELDRSHVDSLRVKLASLELPIGWGSYGPDEAIRAESSGLIGLAFNWGKRHIIGWIFTAFAVSLGAHFWFDLLSRVVKLRASGKSPAEEKKKDPKKP